MDMKMDMKMEINGHGDGDGDGDVLSSDFPSPLYPSTASPALLSICSPRLLILTRSLTQHVTVITVISLDSRGEAKQAYSSTGQIDDSTRPNKEKRVLSEIQTTKSPLLSPFSCLHSPVPSLLSPVSISRLHCSVIQSATVRLHLCSCSCSVPCS